MDKEQILAIAKDCGLTVGQHWNRSNMTTAFMSDFANAAIESYKAELLKEAGEPVYQVCKSDSVSLSAAWIDVTEQTYNDAGLYPEYGRRILYTSDQLAAAIIKATKPLEERRCEICGYAEHHREHTSCLRIQLAKAEQLWQVAQGRCDGLEEKLAKAEQRVAEAIATMFDESGTGGIYLAEMVRNSDWRKFVKEV